MATPDSAIDTCATCGKTPARRCTSCYDAENTNSNIAPTFYCSNDCLKKDWPSHKDACRAAQLEKIATKKLFRAGQLLQEAFLATRAEVFDISIESLRQSKDGKLVIFSGPKDMMYGPINFDQDPATRGPVLSYSAGGEAFTGMMYELATKAFKGYTKKVEEIDCRHLPDLTMMTDFCNHHILRVTLKDGSRWAIDIAGLQHGQTKPVMRFEDYKSEYVEKILACRAYGANSIHPERPICKRRPGSGMKDMLFACMVAENLEYQIDELEEWVFRNGPADAILNAEGLEFCARKDMLVNHLATAAREYTKLAGKDPSSTAKPILVLDKPPQGLSEEDKGRMARKKARKLANMSPEVRQHMERARQMGLISSCFDW